MNLQCDKCGKSYPTNAALYQHKNLAHPEPKLMLVNHSHGSSPSSNKRPRSYNIDYPKAKKQELLPPVTKHSHPKEKPRDYEIKPNPTPQKDDGQADDNLRIVDSYNDDGQTDEGLQVIDSYDNDGQSDDGLTVVDSIDRVDYKQLYENCLASKKRVENVCQRKLLDLKKKHEEKTNALKEDYRDKLRRFGDQMKAEYDERIEKMQDTHGRAIKDLKEAHDKAMEDFERECKKKIKLLSDQLQAIKDDDDDLSSLTKAIFNCTTMEEIFKIQKLINNHQIDELIQNHLPTLQNLLLSLSFGILPICQPQRDQVTNEQRRVVEQLQTASPSNAKNILRNKRGDVINLFTIIKDSIKLARDTYNRYNASN
jgi:hypothetical protein